jgi:ribonuclease VapC
VRSVIDASALLCLLNNETGAEIVIRIVRGAMISAVNLSETLVKTIEKGGDCEATLGDILRLELEIVPFDQALAKSAAALRPATRRLGFSFADRACLALAKDRMLPVFTADRDWSKIDLGIDVRQIR